VTLILAHLQFSSLDRDLEDDMEQASHIHLHSLFGMTALCAPCYWHISAWYVTHASVTGCDSDAHCTLRLSDVDGNLMVFT
jgi:hypothetical protein